MRGNNLFATGGLSGKGMVEGLRPRGSFPAQPGEKRARNSEETEAAWQKHVMAALWISLALLIMLTVALLFGNAHGLFHSSANGPTSAPPWPVGWP